MAKKKRKPRHQAQKSSQPGAQPQANQEIDVSTSVSPKARNSSESSKSYIIALIDEDGCQLWPAYLQEPPCYLFIGSLQSGMYWLYEQHMMSLDDDNLPRDPETRSETYHNVEGMVRAWKRFGVFDEWGRSSATGLKQQAVTEAKLRRWMRLYACHEKHQAKDVGMRKQSADAAVIESFKRHANDPNCVAIILGGICHDRGYIAMLQEYLQREPDGGKVLLLTGWGTRPEYADLPFQIVQIPTLFRPRPPDPSHDDWNMPWEKPRGSYSDAFAPPTLMSRRLKQDESQTYKHYEGAGFPPISRWLKVWVLHEAGGPVAVYCTEADTLRDILDGSIRRTALSRGLMLPPIHRHGHSWRFTVDHGVTTLDEYMEMTLGEFGVRWGSTVELIMRCDCDPVGEGEEAS